MTTSTGHCIVAYDRRTERLVVSHDVPRSFLRMVGDIARVSRDEDTDALGSYPLEESQLREIEPVIGKKLDGPYDFFLEPVPATTWTRRSLHRGR
jgi:hypothetical protein